MPLTRAVRLDIGDWRFDGPFASMLRNHVAQNIGITGLYIRTIPTASLINVNSVMNMNSKHGDYSWVTDFFRWDYASANSTLEQVQELFPDLAVIKHVKDVRLRLFFSVKIDRSLPLRRLYPYYTARPKLY